MNIDARKLENQSIIQGDLCIIGSGAAGTSIAMDWMNSNKKVIVLEGGGFEYDDKVQDLYRGTSTGQKYYPLKSCRLHYFGGTTNHWAGMCSPFDNVDFIKREWVPDSGWPITRAELDPYFAKAMIPLKLGPYEFSYEYWNDKLPNLNPFPLDSDIFYNKMWQYTTIRFSNDYKDVFNNTSNIDLYTYANVVDIVADENVSTIKEVTVKNYEGKTHTVRAKNFIMACGAIQNARMLLACNKQAPNGLGNDNDIVGRYFMEHLEIASAELWLFKPFPTDLYSWKFGETPASAEISLTERAQANYKVLNGTASLRPLSVAQYMKPRMETWQNEDPNKSADAMFENWGSAREKGKNEDGAIARAYQLNTRLEQAPNPNSRVTLLEEKDSLGVPRANLNWELTALDKYSIRKFYELLAQHIGASGVGRVKLREYLWDENDSTFPDSTNGGWHHMGTTRMSDDPKKGVVDKDCKVFGIDNLYIAGSGCFSTAGAPNPTLTLTALSLKLSDHLKNKSAIS